MITKLVLLITLVATAASAQTSTYSAASPNASARIDTLRLEVLSGDIKAVAKFWADVQKNGAPLIEAVPGEPHFSFVTFLWRGDANTRNVVIFDGVASFDATDRMKQLSGTDVWYKTYKVRNDARFAYNLSPNDPLTSVNDVKGDDAMRARLAMLQVDPLNPHRCPTTFGVYGTDASFVELPDAPPMAWDENSTTIAKGKVEVTSIHSGILKEEKKLWVYTPPGFAARGKPYPLLVLFDGDRNVMWIPKVLDILIAKKQIPPMVMVMTDDSVPSGRRAELPCNPEFADFLAKELVPWTRDKYHATTDAAQTIVAGSSYGGLASVFAGLRHSEVFGNVISLSGSFFWKPDNEKEGQWLVKQMEKSPKLPLRFYQEVGLMEGYSFQIAANEHMRDVLRAKGYPVGYFEYNGGHSYLNWAGGMERGLKFLTHAFLSAQKSAQPPAADPALLLRSDAQLRTARATEWLHSEDMRLVAWGAWLARHDHQTALIPLLIQRLHEYQTAESPSSQMVQRDRHDAMLALLDALIGLGADVPPEDARKLYPEFAAQSLILLIRSQTNSQSELFDIFHGVHANWNWLAVGNRLMKNPPPGFAALLLKRFTQHITVSVVDAGFGGGSGGGGSECGFSFAAPKAEWPTVGLYLLTQFPDRMPMLTANLLISGDNSIYFWRVEPGNYDNPPESPGFCYDGNRDQYRSQYLARLVRSFPQRLPLDPYPRVIIDWKGEADYRQKIRTILDDQRLRFKGVVSSLQESGSVLTSVEAGTLKPRLEILIRDERANQSIPLPDVLEGSDAVPVREAFTRPLE